MVINKSVNIALKLTLVLVMFVMQFIFISPQVAFAATDPNLGVATGYGAFGVAGVTETAAQASHIWGDVGDNGLGHVSLISTQVGGTLYSIAQPTIVSAISSAYGDLASVSQGATTPLALAGTHTVGPGLYDVAAGTLDGTLTLDGAGVYIFRSTSSITVNGGTMSLINGATACNVFWQIPESMTITSAAHMEGTIITNTGLISFVSGASLVGRAWAHTQVTMDNNQITQPNCVVATPTPTSTPLSCSSDQHLDASGQNCVSYTIPGVESPSQSSGGTTSTGQVLGATTLASTGSTKSEIGITLMVLGSTLAFTSFYVFKKRAF